VTFCVYDSTASHPPRLTVLVSRGESSVHLSNSVLTLHVFVVDHHGVRAYHHTLKPNCLSERDVSRTAIDTRMQQLKSTNVNV